MDIQNLYKIFLRSTGISTDTRKIEPGSIFVALKGASFNGNEFAKDALSKGAIHAIVDEQLYELDDDYTLVPNALKALQALANYHRKQLNIPVLAITGTNGKTTSKELVNAVLSKKYKTHATKGNLNNHIGVALTLLAMPKDTELAIIEMGANHQKEIEAYCKFTEPTHGMITNIGKAHLEGFGGFEGVKIAKGELYEYLFKTNGTAFINSGNDILRGISKFSSPVYYYDEKDFYHCEFLSASPYIKFKAENDEVVTTELIGKYNFENIAAALCIGKYFEVPAKDANDAVASYVPTNNRSQVIQKRSNEIILDAYNANPSSMKAAIENFVQMKKDKKAIILGDMFELGPESKREHEALGKQLSGQLIDKIIFCGKEMKYAKENCHHAMYFAEKKELEQWLKEQKLEGYEILIKGSRGMGLESLVEVV